MILNDPHEVRQLLLEAKMIQLNENLSIEARIAALEVQLSLMKFQVATGMIHETAASTH